MTLMLRGSLLLGLYMHVIALPLVVGALWPGEARGRPFLTQFAVAMGYTGLTIAVLELALVSKIGSVASVFGQDALLQFHRQMGIFGTALIATHAALAFVNGYPIEWLNPVSGETPWAMKWGIVSAAMLLLLVFVSLGRRALRVPYDWWELTHSTFADIAIVTGFLHALMLGTFAASRPMAAVLGAYLAFAVCLRAWFRVIRPFMLWRRPWEVVRNIEEHSDTRTLVLRPVGHDGFVFEPGQFAWLSTAATPFHWDRHPISMSSAALDERGQAIAFTIKNLGDWSGDVVPALAPGRRVWVDGPHGVFTADRQQGPGYVLIGGGAGISPLFSICETLAARKDVRPIVLFFASRDEEGLTFRGRFDELARTRDLKAIYVVEDPPPGWNGERGYLTAEILRKYLGPEHRRFQYFVCGPEPMMDAVEEALGELKVPVQQVHTERFVMV